MTGRARICTQADSPSASADQCPDEGSQGINLVRGLQRVLLGQGQPQHAAGDVAGFREPQEGGGGRLDFSPGAGPSRFDRSETRSPARRRAPRPRRTARRRAR